MTHAAVQGQTPGWLGVGEHSSYGVAVLQILSSLGHNLLVFLSSLGKLLIGSCG